MQGRKKTGFGSFLSVLGDTPHSTKGFCTVFIPTALTDVRSLATMQDCRWYVRENRKSYPMAREMKEGISAAASWSIKSD